MDGRAAQLQQIKETCQGMLPPEVYARLFELGGTCAGGTMVEIGTYCGAAATTLALGARAAGKPARVVSADPFDRGSTLVLGTVSENVARVLRNFDKFGIADDVTLVAGQVDHLLTQADPREIRLLLIDADGRIDRDLAALFDRLAPEAIVVIDDSKEMVVAHPQGRNWIIDQKHRLTALLCTALCESGILIEIDRLGQTAFFRKGEARLTPQEWTALALDCYRELVFAEIEAARLGWIARLRRTYGGRFPRLARLVRRPGGGDN